MDSEQNKISQFVGKHHFGHNKTLVHQHLLPSCHILSQMECSSSGIPNATILTIWGRPDRHTTRNGSLVCRAVAEEARIDMDELEDDVLHGVSRTAHPLSECWRPGYSVIFPVLLFFLQRFIC